MIDYNRAGATEKQKNILKILNQVVVCKETYATDIVRATDISLATVSRAIAVLKKAGIVVTKGKEITDMGRHPEIYSLNAEYGYLLHFYVDAGSIRGYLADICGEVLEEDQVEIDRSIVPEVFGEKLRLCTDRLIERRQLPYGKLLAASIAIPGLVDMNARSVRRIPNFVNFQNVNLFRFAEMALDMPVIINNEARLCAFGAFIHEFPDKPNLVYIDFTQFSGIGAGIMTDGKLLTGKNGFAGEMGDILVDIHNFENGYHEDEGCLEAMAGAGVLYAKLNALVARGRAGILKEVMTMEGTDTLTLEMIEKAVLMQDLDVMDVFDDTMKMWAIAIINLSAMLDPDLLILGGVVNKKNDVVLARIRHYASKILFHDINIVLSETNEYQVFGGLHMLKTHVLNMVMAKRLLDSV